MSDGTKRESWHLSKSVPVTLILSLAVQTTVFVWFLSGLNSDVIKNTEDIEDNKGRIVRIEKDSREQSGALIRIEQNVNHIKESVEDLKDAVSSRP